MANVLEIERLTKSYDLFTLREVSFALPEGYIMGLVGPNGAGKTTVIKLILNLVRRDAGRIRVFGLDPAVQEKETRSRIGFVHEDPKFHDYLTLKQIRSYVAPFYPTWDENAFQRRARDFDLPLNKRYRELSRGTRMKFAIALALSHRADLIIMDEPTSGLDPVFRREFLEHLSEILLDERKSILFSTHITADLERIADYVTFLLDGRIVFSAAKDDILAEWGIVRGGLELLETGARQLFRGIRRGEFGFEALTDSVSTVRRQLRDRVVVNRASLEDIVYYASKGNHHV